MQQGARIIVYDQIKKTAFVEVTRFSEMMPRCWQVTTSNTPQKSVILTFKVMGESSHKHVYLIYCDVITSNAS
jgi:hypothetical protein